MATEALLAGGHVEASEFQGRQWPCPPAGSVGMGATWWPFSRALHGAQVPDKPPQPSKSHPEMWTRPGHGPKTLKSGWGALAALCLCCLAGVPLPPLCVGRKSSPARRAHPAAPMLDVPSAEEGQRPKEPGMLRALLPGLLRWAALLNQAEALLRLFAPASASMGFLSRQGSPPLLFCSSLPQQ